MKTFSLIAAMTQDRVIGINNQIPWCIPEELQYFRKITLGKAVIMGRKTFTSIGKPLPKRINIVITSAPPQNAQHDNLFFVKSIVEAQKLVESLSCPDEIMVIGGAAVYAAFLPIASKLYLSIVKNNYLGDVFFPVYNTSDWQLDQTTEEKEYVAQVWSKKISARSL